MNHRTPPSRIADPKPFGVLSSLLFLMKKPLKLEDLNVRSWDRFYQICYVVVCVVTWIFFMVTDKGLSLILLIAVEAMFIPIVAHQFYKVMKKKPKI